MSKQSTIKKPTAGKASSLNIYQLAPAKTDEKKMLQIFSQFKLSGKGMKTAVIERKGSFVYTEGNQELTVDRNTGAYRIINKLLWQTDDGKADMKEMNDEAAVKIAQRYISKYKIAPSKEYKLLRVARLIAGARNLKTEETEERIISVDVAFQRIIDNIPVDGPGGKIIVSLAPNAEVSGCEVMWRKIAKKLRPVTGLKTQAAAMEETYKFLPGERENMIVRNVRFGYFEEGWKNEQQYLQPAYLVFLTLPSPDPRFKRKTVYVAPAALNAAGRITPIKKKVRPQSARETK